MSPSLTARLAGGIAALVVVPLAIGFRVLAGHHHDQTVAAQQRSAERRAEAELCRMSAAMHESVRVIREQVQLEHAATESALQERELQILKLNLQEGVTTLES